MFEILIITLKQEAEYIQQEQNAHAVEVSEKSFVVVQRQVVGDDIADDVGDANNHQQLRVYEA